MTEAIVIALIAASGSVIGQAFISAAARKRDAIERAVLDERTDNRLTAIEHSIDGLTVQVKEHNGLKQDIAAMRADIANLKERA